MSTKKKEAGESVVPASRAAAKARTPSPRRKAKAPPRKSVAEMRAEAALRDKTTPKTVGQRMAAPVRKPAAKSKAKKSIGRQIVAQMASRGASAAGEPPVQKKPSPKGPSRFSKEDLEEFRQELLYIRGRILKKIQNLRQHALKPASGSVHEEEGSDAYERFSSIERSSGDHDILYHVDEALHAIEEGTYGICTRCGSLIQKPRLQALPFAKHCIRCQAQLERTFTR